MSFKQLKKSALRVTLAGLITGFGAAQFSPAIAQTVSSFTADADGATCLLSNGGRLKVQVCGPKVIRIVYTMGTTIPAPQGLVVGKTSFTPGTFTTATDNGTADRVGDAECYGVRDQVEFPRIIQGPGRDHYLFRELKGPCHGHQERPGRLFGNAEF